jgi:hypothetical protein
MSRGEDTSANTAMFQAFVDDDVPAPKDQDRNRTKLLLVGTALVLVVVAGAIFALS